MNNGEMKVADVINIEILQKNGVGYSDLYFNVKENISMGFTWGRSSLQTKNGVR